MSLHEHAHHTSPERDGDNGRTRNETVADWVYDHLWQILAIGFALIVLVCLDVGYRARQEGDQTLHASGIHACYRGVRDRGDIAEKFYADVVHLRRDEIPFAHGARKTREQTEAQVDVAIARDLNSRTDPAHSVTWPRVPFNAPATAHRVYPLGKGVLSCPNAYPAPKATFFRLW